MGIKRGTRYRFWAILLAGLLAFLCRPNSGPGSEREIPANVRAAVDAAIVRMRPALVRIHVVSAEYREGREMKMQAVGSGSIISKDGYLITNHHVAGHAERMVCTLWNREEIEAELVGTDPLTDISVLKLKPGKPREFVAASFGDSSKINAIPGNLARGVAQELIAHGKIQRSWLGIDVQPLFK